MFILSNNGKKIINFDNVASVYMKNEFMRHSNSPTWWEIRVMYPAVGSDILYDKLGEFETEEECKDTFDKLCSRIANGKEKEVINMKDL